MRPIDEHLFASGDEDGVVKLWDNRVSGWEGAAVMECKQFEEFVSDIFVDEAKKIMVASSGEGWNYLICLSSYRLNEIIFPFHFSPKARSRASTSAGRGRTRSLRCTRGR